MLGVTCQLCGKRPATAHLTEIDPQQGHRQELHLCATCIHKLDLKLEAGPPPIAIILGMKNDQEGAATIPLVAEAPASEGHCPLCGLTFHDFTAGKLFGCPYDYTAFPQVEGLLSRYHGTARHTGRLPGRPGQPGAEQRQSAVARLDAALRDAVAREHYEQAARLRDELRRLEHPAP
jgi:protein arginine kinase activator